MRLAIIALAASAAAASAIAVPIIAVPTIAMAAKAPALTTPAPPSGTGLPRGQCFRSHDIRNHTIADRNTLLVDVNGRATYRITMRDNCLAAAIPSDPLITRTPPGSTIICKPIDLDIGIARNGFTTQCIVDSIVKMSPAELAALPRKLKP